jgi:alkylhydroperoxidase family enzyme
LPRKTDSNNPTDWLAIAESELEAIQLLVSREICCDMCRGKLAEILEKILKAELMGEVGFWRQPTTLNVSEKN